MAGRTSSDNLSRSMQAALRAVGADTPQALLAFELKKAFLGRLRLAMYRHDRKWSKERIEYPADCGTLDDMITWLSMILDPRHTSNFFKAAFRPWPSARTRKGRARRRVLEQRRRHVLSGIIYKRPDIPDTRLVGVCVRFDSGRQWRGDSSPGWDNVVRAYEEVQGV